MERDWIRESVADGLGALLALRLKNTPAEDMIELTADIWVRAFRKRVFIQELDAPRIRAAFDEIFPRIREWPAPRDVLELMPPRPPQLALPAPVVSDEQHAKNVARVKDMISNFMNSWGPQTTRTANNGEHQ
ncbi:MAG: hypothetical protein V1791_06810 [Pseudomonadota bacterium]